MSESKPKPKTTTSSISLDRVQPPGSSSAEVSQSDEADVSEANPLVRNSARKLQVQDRVIEEKQAREEGVFTPAAVESNPDDLDLTVSGHRPRGDDALRPGQVFSDENTSVRPTTDTQSPKRRASGS